MSDIKIMEFLINLIKNVMIQSQELEFQASILQQFSRCLNATRKFNFLNLIIVNVFLKVADMITKFAFSKGYVPLKSPPKITFYK